MSLSNFIHKNQSRDCGTNISTLRICGFRSNSQENDWANPQIKFDSYFFESLEDLKYQIRTTSSDYYNHEIKKPKKQKQESQQWIEPNEQEKQLIIENEVELCQDALQLEAFYYQLTEFGFTRSPMLSLSPFISYYIYSILTFDLDNAFQYCNKDKQLYQFLTIFQDRKVREDQLYLQSFFQSQFQLHQSKKRLYYGSEYTQLLAIIPQNIQISDIDQDILIKDLELYSNQQINKQQSILQFLDDTSRDKNNILLANIRFIFKDQSTNQIIQFRYPISDFDQLKWLDCKKIHLQKHKQFSNFIFKYHSHSEKIILLWLLEDAANEQRIFQKLKNSIRQKNIIQQQLNLNSIQIELTLEKRLNNCCVDMLNEFPISFYCDQLLECFGFNIEEKFYLIFLEQYLVDCRFEEKDDDLEKQIFSIIEHKEEIMQKSLEIRVQRNRKIKYFIIQKEIEPIGLISKRMFDYRYKKNRNQFKTEIDKVILQNTFFLSYSKVETSKSSSSKSSKSRENQLLDSLDNQKQKFDIFKQAQEYNKAHQIVQAQKTLATLIEEFITSFQSTLIKKYCSLVEQKNFSKFQIYELIILFEYIFLSKEVSFHDPPVFRKILSNVEHRQIIFNQNINRSILFKDYFFLKSQVTVPLQNFLKKKNEIHNEFSIKIFSNNLRQNNWQEKLNLQDILQINNCIDFTKFLQNIIENCNFKQNDEYQLIICTLYEIDQQCQNQIIHFFQGNQHLNQLKLIIKFIAIGMEIEQESQQNFKQINIQNQFYINFEKSNILSYDRFLKRYKINQDSMIRYPFDDTQNQIQNNLACFDCQEHDKYLNMHKVNPFQ